MVGVGLDLAAHAAHEDGQRLEAQFGIVAPDVLEYPVGRQRLVAVAGQQKQQLELALRQAGRCAVDERIAPVYIYHQRADLDLTALLRRLAVFDSAAQVGADARHQFTRRERLGQVVVRADFEAHDFIGVIVACRQEEDRHPVLRAYLTAERKAVLIRQPDIQHDQIERLALKRPPRLLRADGGLAKVALGDKQFLDGAQDESVVIYQQQARHGRRPPSMASPFFWAAWATAR